MSNYRRERISGGTYFFTVVTAGRRPILTTDKARDSLRSVIAEVRREYPFAVKAWVLLPDHLHCLWELPEGDADFSKRWGKIKAGFSKRVGEVTNNSLKSKSRARHRESTIWQRRFWEHRIRDEEDFQRHMDYIHFNPVKHRLAACVREWPYSTFHRCVQSGIYPENWGGDKLPDSGDAFGE